MARGIRMTHSILCYRVTLVLELGSRLGDGRVIIGNIGDVSLGVCLIVIKGDCRALAEVCAQLSATLFVVFTLFFDLMHIYSL